jgi:hypothetical protein
MPIPPIAIMPFMPATFERVEVASAVGGGGLIPAASGLHIAVRRPAVTTSPRLVRHFCQAMVLWYSLNIHCERLALDGLREYRAILPNLYVRLDAESVFARRNSRVANARGRLRMCGADFCCWFRGMLFPRITSHKVVGKSESCCHERKREGKDYNEFHFDLRFLDNIRHCLLRRFATALSSRAGK